MEQKEKEHEWKLSERNRDRIARLTLMDDDFMTRFFKGNTEVTALVLRIILGKSLNIVSVNTQDEIKSLRGHSAVLDVMALDTSGTRYDIEIQRSDKGAEARRARYYSSLIDAESLGKGDEYSKLPESYVIFITERDVLGDGEVLYEIERLIKKTGRNFNDGSHIIYVNCENEDAETELGRLIHDFKCQNPQDMYYASLGSRMQQCKGTKQEAVQMGMLFDELREEGRAEGIKKGRIEGAMETKISAAKNLFSFNLSAEQISQAVGLPVEQVLALR